jgi:DNA-binding FadR family transcriptional regulator
MQALRDSTETAEFYRRNLEFHAEVAELCLNPILRTIYRSLLDVVQSQDPKLALLPGQNAAKLRARRTKIHQDVADAVALGDIAAARSAAIAHARHGHARPATLVS